jgi:hypothetical protein
MVQCRLSAPVVDDGSVAGVYFLVGCVGGRVAGKCISSWASPRDSPKAHATYRFTTTIQFLRRLR